MKPLLARIIFWPTFLWNLLLGRCLKRRRWWDVVEEKILLGARPLRRDVSQLSELGVRAVVNTCEEFPGPTDLYRKYRIEQLWLPTCDFHPPTLDAVRLGVEFIERNYQEGNKVYVHCKAGRARSATVVLCWLMKYRNLDPQQAQQQLLKARPHVKRDLDQRKVVQAYYREIHQHR